MVAQLELERLQLERAKVEREKIKARVEVQSAASCQVGQENVTAVSETPGLPGFMDGKDNLDNYQLRFEKYVLPLRVGNEIRGLFGLAHC